MRYRVPWLAASRHLYVAQLPDLVRGGADRVRHNGVGAVVTCVEETRISDNNSPNMFIRAPEKETEA